MAFLLDRGRAARESGGRDSPPSGGCNQGPLHSLPSAPPPQPLPPAKPRASGSERSLSIAAMPIAGPGANMANAALQPQCARASGTSHSVATVSVKPSASWSVSAVPTYAGSASSVTIVENCAESATTHAPQTSATAGSSHAGPSAAKPTASAHAHETAIASAALVVRPTRSL